MNGHDFVSWIEIKLDNIAHNTKEIKKIIGKDVCLMATVKADAYGHGSFEVASVALANGAEKIGVANLYEGIELRKKGIKAPILILGLSPVEHAEKIIKYDLMQTVCDYRMPEVLSEYAIKYNKEALLNIKVNTGMNRIGVECDEALDYVKSLLKISKIKIEGIFTHLATSYMEEEFTNIQFKRFTEVLRSLEKEGINIPYKHCCNTGGVLNFPGMYLNQVRPGALITTKYSKISSDENNKFLDSMEIKSKIMYIRDVPEGQGVGYNLLYKAKKDIKIAVIPIGWGDGFPRELSNKAYVLLKGKKCPVIGRICCDQIIVDISSVDNPKLSDEVVIIGTQNGVEIPASQWAELIIKWISSHLTQRTLLSNRLPKIFYYKGEKVALKYPLYPDVEEPLKPEKIQE